MKYILFEVAVKKDLTLNIPFVFPNVLVHQDAAEHLQHLLCMTFDTPEVKPVSAGFFNTLTGQCGGRSESMGLESRPQDSDLVRLADYGV